MSSEGAGQVACTRRPRLGASTSLLSRLESGGDRSSRRLMAAPPSKRGGEEDSRQSRSGHIRRHECARAPSPARFASVVQAAHARRPQLVAECRAGRRAPLLAGPSARPLSAAPSTMARSGGSGLVHRPRGPGGARTAGSPTRAASDVRSLIQQHRGPRPFRYVMMDAFKLESRAWSDPIANAHRVTVSQRFLRFESAHS